LGFAEQERKLYIEQSLKGQPHSIKELTEYLKRNLTIDSLCFIPFNMVILIYLYKQGIPLPSNSTQLYNYFICLTICRHLAKSGHPLENTFSDLANLPEPCNTIVKQVSKLALEGISKNKLVFTLQEMKAASPDFAVIPGAVNCFGLLQAVQHFGLTGNVMTFNFAHFSIQEFLAAYHITKLPPDEELQLLKAKFWNDFHSNLFTMYIALTKGQRSAFKQFLSCGNNTIAISKMFLKDQLKCLHLFHSFYEANDVMMYSSIQQAEIFSSKVIDLTNSNIISLYNIECVTLFLTCSPHKKWKKLKLYGCHIQDIGFSALSRNLMKTDVTIRELDLSDNDLTTSSSSISDLIIHCRVEVLDITGNHTIGEDPTLYNMSSHPSSRLVKLYMSGTCLSSSSTIVLFTALAKGNKLQQLYINNNLITDEACDVIATTMKNNSSLAVLGMYGNKISGEAAQHLVQALQHNNILQLRWLPFSYTDDVKKTIRSLQEEINKNRESKGSQTELAIWCL